MRRQPIPPLCGGAVQALPNIQTTLRDHPHPASRPMTLGHFTSWPADDRGYYTGVGYTHTELRHLFGARMCPAWCNCDMQCMKQTERQRAHRERERSWSHYWGNFLGRCGNTDTSVTHEVGHDTTDTYSQDSCSHFWSNFLGSCDTGSFDEQKSRTKKLLSLPPSRKESNPPPTIPNHTARFILELPLVCLPAPCALPFKLSLALSLPLSTASSNPKSFEAQTLHSGI